MSFDGIMLVIATDNRREACGLFSAYISTNARTGASSPRTRT